MKLISWNINSLRLRLPLVKEFVLAHNPDVICFQEIKVEDSLFPLLEVRALGYEFVEFSGEKSYNGVAIFSKFPLKNRVVEDVHNYGHKRHIAVDVVTKSGDVTLHNFYVPAGGDIPDAKENPKFDHKLKFVDWMAEYFSSHKKNPDTKNKKIIIVGDFNIAPLEHDVWSHKQMLKIVSHTPIEVEKLNNLKSSLDFVDSHRLFVNENEKLYSWWSYRAADPLGSDRGRRLDHIWTTPNLKENISSAKIYKDFRIKNQPSDHVPIETVFKF